MGKAGLTCLLLTLKCVYIEVYMIKIKVLSEEVANRIAAGEVVERPASVVKELTENAIDAGATRIQVIIDNGGKDLIQVSDNGCGMCEDDAILAFERHATSKIKNVEDIFRISSLGFRGEALPSIASVSQLTLVTRDQESELATQIDFSGGRLLQVSKTAANIGTTITIRKLFSNVPARRKFLRTEAVEFKHILKYLHYQSLIYPGISFRFISNGKEKLYYPGTDTVDARFKAVFGSDFLDRDWVKIDDDRGDVSLTGYIYGLNEEFTGYEDYRYLFVNGRFINDKIIQHSIKTAYEPFIQKARIYKSGQTPPYLLFLQINPELVDVNVHPAKLEVRFRDGQLVHNLVKSSIVNALTKYEEQRFGVQDFAVTPPSITTESNASTFQFSERFFQPPQSKNNQPSFNQYKKEFQELYQSELFPKPTINPAAKLKDNIETISQTPPQNISQNVASEEDLVNPWQLHQSYIFIQVEDGLMVIDQHAAHERILYERMIKRIHGEVAITQKLLFPLVIELPPYLSPTIKEQIELNVDTFYKLGFSIKTFSGNSIVIDEVPAELEDWRGGEVFLDILKQFEDEFEVTENFRDSMAKSVACKAAIKAGHRLSKKEMLALINDLFACDVPYFCPHGRPLMIKLGLDEFEKRFKRIE